MYSKHIFNTQGISQFKFSFHCSIVFLRCQQMKAKSYKYNSTNGLTVCNITIKSWVIFWSCKTHYADKMKTFIAVPLTIVTDSSLKWKLLHWQEGIQYEIPSGSDFLPLHWRRETGFSELLYQFALGMHTSQTLLSATNKHKVSSCHSALLKVEQYSVTVTIWYKKPNNSNSININPELT